MRLRQLDLNLLLVFNALFQHRSTKLAAAAIGLTQPAVSHALARLRLTYDDALFVRQRQTMQPTPRALELIEPIAQALDLVAGTLDQNFVPLRLNRAFNLGLAEYPGMYFFARPDRCGLNGRAERQDHYAVLERRAGAARLIEADLDFIVGVLPEASLGEGGPGLVRAELSADGFAVITRQNHPTIGQHLSPEEFLDARHVHVSLFETMNQRLEQILPGGSFAKHAENPLWAPFVVANSDLLATLPRTIARAYQKVCRLSLYPLPFDIGEYRLSLAWHARSSGDQAHKWMRERIVDVALSVPASCGLRTSSREVVTKKGQLAPVQIIIRFCSILQSKVS